jgi:hypothetical protein
MKNRLRRLERGVKAHYIIIPQPEGPPARFPESAAQEAFLASLARLKGNLDVPEHPLSTAAATSSDSRWRGSFVAGTHTVTGDGRELGEPIPDLSEP